MIKRTLMFKYIFLGFFIISLINAETQWRDKKGKIVEPNTSMKSEDGFGVQLLSVNEKNFFKVWNTPSQTVDIDIIDTIHKNTELIFPIIFGGCKIAKDSKCHIISDFLILAPDGTIYADVKKMHLFASQPYPNHALNVSTEYLKIIIEKKDLLGEYKVQAHVSDIIKKIDLNIEKSFTVVDDNVTIKKKIKQSIEPYKPTEEDINISKWMTYAYKNGYEKDMDKIIYMLNSRLFTDNKSSFFVMSIFISERFKINDSYLIKYENKFKNLNENALEILLFALKQADTKNSNNLYIKLLNNVKNMQFLNYIKSVKPFRLLEMNIMNPSMIDTQWASFMATGKKDYVEKIITLLGLPEKDANNLLLLSSAKWSLLSNAKQHEKVLKICKEYKSKNKEIEKNLNEILSKVNNK